MKVIDFENFLLHPDLAVAEAAISGGPILVSGCRAGTAVILSLDAYNELKCKLIEKGIPQEQIAYIHEAKKDNEKLNLFNKVKGNVL